MNGSAAAMLLVTALVAGAQDAAPVAPADPATTLRAPVADAARAGRYHLQGVMEVGSELLLTEQGTFEWYFAYGALDLAGRGRWRYEGADVVLVFEEFLTPPGHEAMRFERMKLRADGEELVPGWPWDGGAERGRYSRD